MWDTARLLDHHLVILKSSGRALPGEIMLKKKVKMCKRNSERETWALYLKRNNYVNVCKLKKMLTSALLVRNYLYIGPICIIVDETLYS